MKKRLLFIAVAAFSFTLMFAQNEEKYSVTTQMFLQELQEEPSIAKAVKAKIKANEQALGLKPVDPYMGKSRLYAAPDTVNGIAYIPAYVRLENNSNTSELEAQGVIVQERFGKSLITALVPVDKISDVAGISHVHRINVSELKRPLTNAARQKTNVDDILTQSADAISAGLTKKYDGSGVILGVIDTGIDFNHIAFKDKNGNSRIKKAYVYNGSNAQEYSSITSTTLTDDNSEDHGTHTCSTAGGSSVIVSGTTVTVTDDHANATYGGMAPGADLYLAGINSLNDTYLSNAVNKMCTYADQQGKPLVVSNSWGSQIGPHDGTGDVADVYNSLFGDSHPNRIALFAASNDGGKSKDNEGGGYHVSGTATSSNPLRSILRCASYIDTDAGYYYYGIIANAWARSTSVSSMTCKIYVLDSSTGDVKTTITVNPSTSGATVSGLSTYYSGTLYAYKDYLSSNKTQVLLYAPNGLTSRSTTTTTQNGETYYKSKYTLAVEFAPSSGSSIIDVWGGSYGYFTNHLTTSGYNWTAGSDDMSVSDEAMISNVISVGAYVSKTDWTAYNGTSYTSTDEYTMGEIAGFSSYATAAASPDGNQYPWITAPGARLCAGVNHNHTTSVDNYSYYGSNYNSDLVVNNSSNPYAMMEGTSMATPTVAGIVALWLQASLEDGAAHKNLTVNDVKTIMQETAINDSFTTTGANASHFGKGKIDALAGIQYILGVTSIIASPTNLSFSTELNESQTQNITVKGLELSGNITATLNDPSGKFTISKTTFTPSEYETGATLAVTFNGSDTEGTFTGTITLSSAGANNVIIDLSAEANDVGKASDAYLNIAKYATIDDAGWNTTYVNKLYKYTEYKSNGYAWLTLPIYGAWSSVYYNSHPQKWIDSNVNSTTNAYAGTSWNSSNNLLGSSSYFTGSSGNGSARGMGYNSRTNYTQETFSFFVTNTTEVQMLGLGQSRASSSYPATLKVYECTVNNGTPTASTTAVKSESNSATSGTFVLSATGLDASKVYKVEAATYRSYICEIGFKTPIAAEPEITVNPASLNMTANVGKTEQKTVTVTGTNLTAGISTTINGANAGMFSVSPSSLTTLGGTLTVTYAPTATGNHTATLTLSSTGATDVTVTLNGTATEPELIVDEDALTFSTYAGNTVTDTFGVLGENLNGNVTLTLNDANNVFSLSSSTATKAEAEEGKTFTVSFTPTAEGTYNATVTVSSEGVADQIVNLTGTATKSYVDVTVNSYGLTTLYTDIPLEIPYEEFDDILGVYYGKSLLNNELRIKRINASIPAETAVIIQANSGTYRFPIATGTVSEVAENVLQGTLVNLPVSEITGGTVLTLGRGPQGYIGFYRFAGSVIPAGKAFIVYSDSNEAKGMNIVVDNGDDTATSIFDVAGQKVERDEWYTLQGVRLNGKPVGKGIYIHNGQRELVR